MFKKSLRIQLVAVFILIVLVSLAVSFAITHLLSEKEVTFETKFLTVTGDVATILASVEPTHRDRVIDILADYHIYSEFIEEGSPLPFSLTNEKAAPLFQSTSSDPLFLDTEKGPNPVRLIGVPNIDQKGHSLILKIDFTGLIDNMRKIILTSLLGVLVIGSLLILLASRKIVEPVKKLTNAAKEMELGNLAVRIDHNKKDDLGTLMDSFNQMAIELQKTDKMREDFVSNVSHEIQSPITSIRGFTRAIRDGIIPPEHQKEHLDIIYQETLKLSKLSEHLLKLASLDSDNYPFQQTKYRLDEQLRKIIVVSEPLWSAKSLDIDLHLQNCIILADADLLEQVWRNIIHNAIKYSHEWGRIEITLKTINQAIHVQISDSGTGIPGSELPFLFDRFYMVDKARSSSGGGSGLGLSIVKKIIDLHGYKITVQSEMGKGTCLTVTISL